MNRRDFLKGLGVGVAAAGAAAVVRVASEPVLPPVPDFTMEELRPLWEALVHDEYHNTVSAELVRKAFQYAAALPDNPMALILVHVICVKILHRSRDGNFKAACVNSPEFEAIINKFGKYLS